MLGLFPFWMALLLGLACGRQSGGGGTAVGNPGSSSIALAARADAPWVDARAAWMTLQWTRCDGTVVLGRYTDVDLRVPRSVEVPPGRYCTLRVQLTEVTAQAEGASLRRDVAEAILDLGDARVNAQAWWVELGEPDAPEAIEGRSALYVELEPDGVLDPLERAQAPLAAGPDREDIDAFDPEVVVVVGFNGLRSTLVDAGGLPAAEYPTPRNDDEPELGFSSVAVGAEGGASRWVAVGADDVDPVVSVSDDSGLSWTTTVAPAPMSDVVAYQGAFFACSFEGGVYRSDDGETWLLVYESDFRWTSIATDGVSLVVVGDAKAAVSDDGQAFTEASLPDELRLQSVAVGAPGSVAVGDGGVRWFSVNGVDWVETATGGDKLVDVVWAGTQFIAVGEGTSWTSDDGQSWTAGPDQPLDGLALHQGAVLAVAGDDVWQSTDEGQSWSVWRTVRGAEGALTAGVSNAP